MNRLALFLCVAVVWLGAELLTRDALDAIAATCVCAVLIEAARRR